MTVTKDDFDKIWASTSPLTPYEFSDSQYKQGWNFVGATPPSRQMWDAFMKNADEKLKYLYNHEDVPVGFEYFTMNPNIPQGSLPLLGGEYSRETYADLWGWVQEQTGYLKTEAEWQTLSTANNGNVPYYSSGDGSTTFRVPSLHCWIKGSDGSAQLVGSYLQAGLPNITGFVGTDGGEDPNYNGLLGYKAATQKIQSGAIDYTANVYGIIQNGGTSDDVAKAINRITIDASNSNSIYGNSTTVQPESIVGMWLVKAYGVIVDTGSIDEQAYIDDRFNASKQYTDDRFNASKQYTDDEITAITQDVSGQATALAGTLTHNLLTKVGKWAELNFGMSGISSTAYAWTNIIQLPSGFYPKNGFDTCIIDNTTGQGFDCRVNNATGIISIWSSAVVTEAVGHIVYLVAD